MEDLVGGLTGGLVGGGWQVWSREEWWSGDSLCLELAHLKCGYFWSTLFIQHIICSMCAIRMD